MGGFRGVGRGMVGASFGYGVPAASYGHYQTPTVLYQHQDATASAYALSYPASYSQPGAVTASHYAGVTGYEVQPAQTYATVRYPGELFCNFFLIMTVFNFFYLIHCLKDKFFGQVKCLFAPNKITCLSQLYEMFFSVSLNISRKAVLWFVIKGLMIKFGCVQNSKLKIFMGLNTEIRSCFSLIFLIT